MPTAAQLAFALTKTLSIKIIKKTGKENVNKNLVWKLRVIFLILNKKNTNNMGPIITVCDSKNSNPCVMLISALVSPALSEVW